MEDTFDYGEAHAQGGWVLGSDGMWYPARFTVRYYTSNFTTPDANSTQASGGTSAWDHISHPYGYQRRADSGPMPAEVDESLLAWLMGAFPYGRMGGALDALKALEDQIARAQQGQQGGRKPAEEDEKPVEWTPKDLKRLEFVKRMREKGYFSEGNEAEEGRNDAESA